MWAHHEVYRIKIIGLIWLGQNMGFVFNCLFKSNLEVCNIISCGLITVCCRQRSNNGHNHLQEKETSAFLFKVNNINSQIKPNHLGKIFTTDFVNELNDQGYEMPEDEKSKLLGISDNKGQVLKNIENIHFV